MKRISHSISSRRQGGDNTSSSSSTDNITPEAAEDDQSPISHQQSTTGIAITNTDNEATNTNHQPTPSIINADMTAGITTSLAKLKSPSKEKPTQDSTKIIALIGTIKDRLNEKRSLYNQAILVGEL